MAISRDDLTAAKFREAVPDAPESAGWSDDDVSAALDVAIEMSAVRASATYYCAAHLLALAQADATVATRSGNALGTPDGGAGEAHIYTIPGAVHTTYVTMTKAGERDAFFASTRWGRIFLVLEARSPSRRIGMRVAG